MPTSGKLGAKEEEIRRFVQQVPANFKPRYAGRTVMLIDENAISQSEHTGMMFRAAAGTRFVGSPTSGTNGDTTTIRLPGGVTVSFTGHKVSWPDGTQLQRRGLMPDVDVRPTIEGIRSGRDEVLDSAIRYLSEMPAPSSIPARSSPPRPGR